MCNYIEDEIESIEYLGLQDTIDINVTGNRLFYANDILTHNSAVDEIEFDHSHISGGISKINTADNVFGIFTSRSMRERGRYQIQLMKTRSSSGVGTKVDLEFNMESLRITDAGEDAQDNVGVYKPAANILNQIRTNSTVKPDNPSEEQLPPVTVTAQSTKLKQLLSGLKNRQE
jgi:hypothetical protein